MSEAADTWIEVSRTALEHNLAQVRTLLRPGTRLAAVVKANAYGHGVVAARVFAEAGVDMLAVTHLSEALELRQAGIEAAILVFSPLLAEQVPAAVDAGLTLTAASEEGAHLLSAGAAGRTINVHLKVDLGMGRLGVLEEDAVRVAGTISHLPGLNLEGVYIHFPTAMNRDLSAAQSQLAQFKALLEKLRAAGIHPGISHCANSAALLQLPDTQLDMVRIGTLLYGQYPASFLNGRLSLRPTWKMMTRITSIKDVPAGWPVGYGSEGRTKAASLLAVLPVGYADGFAVEVAARQVASVMDRLEAAARALRGRPPQSVLIGGKRAPVIGRISMQMTTIDVTGVPGVQVGDAVEVPARRVTSNPSLARVVVE